MWDTIFAVINFIEKPYKKKDLHYLVNSRLNREPEEQIIIAHDIKVADKCSGCKNFRPWLYMKNTPESIFLLKKIVEKYEPWVTFGIQESFYPNQSNSDAVFDSYFILVYHALEDQIADFYKLLKHEAGIIHDVDIRVKNQCMEIQDSPFWIQLKKSQCKIEMLEQIKNIFSPYLDVKKHIMLEKTKIPEEYWDLKMWYYNSDLDIISL